jgi:hypothetical protein
MRKIIPWMELFDLAHFLVVSMAREFRQEFVKSQFCFLHRMPRGSRDLDGLADAQVKWQHPAEYS